ncbi:MAG TPA: hypothetical protein VMY99_05255 [Nevskiaceae bacterium]|nr:hypothetical protein [Nevskiaceae bacterium]
MDLSINKEVNVNAFRFTTKKQQLQSVPKEIEFDGASVTFVDAGLHYLIQKGQQLIQLFDMSDGHNTYRLRQDNNNWTLVGMKANA